MTTRQHNKKLQNYKSLQDNTTKVYKTTLQKTTRQHYKILQDNTTKDYKTTLQKTQYQDNTARSHVTSGRSG